MGFFFFPCIRLDSTHKAAVLENIQTQNYTNKYAETENNDTNSEDNQQQEDTYEDAPENFYDKAGNRRHKEPTNCEPFDHTGTAKDTRYVLSDR